MVLTINQHTHYHIVCDIFVILVMIQTMNQHRRRDIAAQVTQNFGKAHKIDLDARKIELREFNGI